MAVAVTQQVPIASLLQRPSGWDYAIAPTVLKTIPAAVYPHVTVEAFEWNDVQLGAGGVQQRAQASVEQLRQQIRARGSDLYAYALVHHTDSNVCLPIVGCLERSDRYRLIVAHSAVVLGAWAILALGALLIAVLVVFQYLTIGQSPALADMQRFFGQSIAEVGQAGGTITSGLSQPFLVFMLAGGVAAILFAQAEKGAGVKAKGGIKQPSGSIGIKTGPLSTRVGT